MLPMMQGMMQNMQGMMPRQQLQASNPLAGESTLSQSSSPSESTKPTQSPLFLYTITAILGLTAGAILTAALVTFFKKGSSNIVSPVLLDRILPNTTEV